MDVWLLLDSEGYTRWCARRADGRVAARSSRRWATAAGAVGHVRAALGMSGYTLHRSR